MDTMLLEKLHKCEVEILDEIVRICDKYELNYFLVGGTLLGAVRHKGFIPWDDDLDIGMPRKDYEKFLKICEKELNQNFILDCFKNNNKYYLPFVKLRRKDTIFKSYNMNKYDGDQGIWVDIFPLDNANKQKSFIQNIQAKIVKGLSSPILQKVNIVEKSNEIRYVLFRPFSVKLLSSIQQCIMKINHNQNSKFFVNLGSNYNYVKQTIPKEKYFPCIKMEFEGKLYNAPKDYDYVLNRIYKNYMELPPVEKRITHNPIEIKFVGEDKIIFKEGEE